MLGKQIWQSFANKENFLFPKVNNAIQESHAEKQFEECRSYNWIITISTKFIIAKYE